MHEVWKEGEGICASARVQANFWMGRYRKPFLPLHHEVRFVPWDSFLLVHSIPWLYASIYVSGRNISTRGIINVHKNDGASLENVKQWSQRKSIKELVGCSCSKITAPCNTINHGSSNMGLSHCHPDFLSQISGRRFLVSFQTSLTPSPAPPDSSSTCWNGRKGSVSGLRHSAAARNWVQVESENARSWTEASIGGT